MTRTETAPAAAVRRETAPRPTRSTDEHQAVKPAPNERVGGVLGLTGAAVMIAGAVCHNAFGADLFAVMLSTDRAEIESNLTDVAEHRTPLMVGLWLWVVGASLMCAGGTLLARRTMGAWSTIARWGFAAATGAVIVFFTAMMAIVEGVAPAHAAGEDVITLATAIGYGAVTADSIATALILGLGYAAAVYSARETWAPSWLVKLATTSIVVSIASLILYRSADFAFVVVIVGFVTVIATGITAVRHAD